jgi:opacity protein-like surface antigen
MKKLLTVAALLLPLAAAAQYEPVGPVYGGEGGRRSPWYIGFGLGTGDGKLKFASGTYSFKEEHEYFWGTAVDPTNLSLNFKVGATLSPTLLVGFDITAVRSQYDSGSLSTGIQVNNYDAVATWFPQGQGFFLRGGVGLSVLTENVDTPLFSTTSSVSGYNVIAGAGYAFWLGPTFNLTVNADYSFQSYGSSSMDPESSRFWALWLGFDWY